jgi:hypothetical protein
MPTGAEPKSPKAPSAGRTALGGEIESLRSQVRALPPPPPGMQPFLGKVRTRAHSITDAEVAWLRERWSEDAIFEQLVAAAVDEGLRRIDTAMALIG